MTPDPASEGYVPSRVLHRLRLEKALLKKLDCIDAERRRARTQQQVKAMAASTPESRIDAAKARAAAVFTQIADIAAQADLTAPAAPPVTASATVRLDDLPTLFACREQLPSWLHERLDKIHAKINWQTRKGQKGYFNKAVNKNRIPIDKALTILAQLKGHLDGNASMFTTWVDSVIECGLYPRIRRGKFEYKHRCQDGEHCELCNYLNISDGLKVLYEGYGRRTFNKGGNWFALTVAPRNHAADARAVGRTMNPEDWNYANPASAVYGESRCQRAFRYDDSTNRHEANDWIVESRIRCFLGAAQFVLGKLKKNGWLDGVRGRVENSVQFLPYLSHQHWHAVGSSKCEHDPQKMAGFIKAEVDAILVQTCPGLYADVMVAAIPTSGDLRRWIKYMNKTVNLVTAVASVYNRQAAPVDLACLNKKLLNEVGWSLERSRRVFEMIRCSLEDERGKHTFMLRKRFVAGTHKFGKRSILFESSRHRLWRERHAKQTAESRAAAE